MTEVDCRLANCYVHTRVAVTHVAEVQTGDVPSLFSARAGQRSFNAQFRATDAMALPPGFNFSVEGITSIKITSFHFCTDRVTRLLQTTMGALQWERPRLRRDRPVRARAISRGANEVRAECQPNRSSKSDPKMLSRRSTIRFGTHKQVLMNGLVRFMRLTVEQLATLLEITISIHCSLDTAVMSGYYRARIYRF